VRHLRTTVAGVAAFSLTAGMAAGALAQDEAEVEMSPGPIGVFSIEDMDWRLSAQVVDGEMTPVPEGVPAGRGILAAQMETAVNVVWDGGVTVGDRVVVVGAGAIGLLVAWLCRGMPGARVTAVDPDPRRREAAQALGVELASTSPDDPRADVVVHASGQADGLRDALALVGRDGTLVEASWFGSREVALPLGGDPHARPLRLRRSQVGHVPPERAARWSRERRRRLALSLLADDTLDALVSGESDFDDLPTVMAELAGDGGGTLCHRIRYPAAAR